MLSLALCAGCKTARKTAAGALPAAAGKDANAGHASEEAKLKAFMREVSGKMEKNKIGFESFSAKAKLDFENDQGKQQGVTAFVRMQRDSVIWISVRPVLGIELVRVLITPQQVKMINYFKKTVMVRNADSLQELLHIPFDFKTLQDLIVGNPVYFNGDHMDSIRQSPSVVSFVCEGADYLSHFDVFADDYLLQHSHITEKNAATQRSCDLQYGDYEKQDNRSFATRRRIFVASKKATIIDIKFNKVDFDKPVSFPFSIGDKYKME